MMRRFAMMLAAAALAAVPAHAANVQRVTGSATNLVGFDSITYENPQSHPFTVSLNVDALLETATTVAGSTPALGSISLTIQHEGQQQAAEAHVWQAGLLTDQSGNRVVILHAVGEDTCTYDVTLWGLTNALVQIERGTNPTCPWSEAHIEASGSSSFTIVDVA